MAAHSKPVAVVHRREHKHVHHKDDRHNHHDRHARLNARKNNELVVVESVVDKQSPQSKFMQELAQKPALTALAGLIASFPVPRIFASNAVPFLQMLNARQESAERFARAEEHKLYDDFEDGITDRLIEPRSAYHKPLYDVGPEPMPAPTRQPRPRPRPRPRNQESYPPNEVQWQDEPSQYEEYTEEPEPHFNYLVDRPKPVAKGREPTYKEAQEYVHQASNPHPTVNVTVKLAKSRKKHLPGNKEKTHKQHKSKPLKSVKSVKPVRSARSAKYEVTPIESSTNTTIEKNPVEDVRIYSHSQADLGSEIESDSLSESVIVSLPESVSASASTSDYESGSGTSSGVSSDQGTDSNNDSNSEWDTVSVSESEPEELETDNGNEWDSYEDEDETDTFYTARRTTIDPVKPRLSPKPQGAIPRVRRAYNRRLQEMTVEGGDSPGHLGFVLAALALGRDVSNECSNRLLNAFGSQSKVDQAVDDIRRGNTSRVRN